MQQYEKSKEDKTLSSSDFWTISIFSMSVFGLRFIKSINIKSLYYEKVKEYVKSGKH